MNTIKEKIIAYGRFCHLNGEYDVPLDTPEAGERLSEIFAMLAAAPTPATVATEAVFQQVSEDDLSALESWLTERGHKNSAFFPADANRLADMTLHMIREVRASRKGVATEAATGKPALQVDAAQEAVAQGGVVDAEKVMGLVEQVASHLVSAQYCSIRGDREYWRAETKLADEAKAQIRAMLMPAAGQGWQPIETAPKSPYGGCLVYNDKGISEVYWDPEENWWYISDGKNDYPLRGNEPTHWQPLPPPPPAIANQEEGK